MNINFRGGTAMGGLVGTNTGTISSCYSSGTIVINSDGSYSTSYGGLVGDSYGQVIEKSYSTMDISGAGSTVGGLVGRCYDNCEIRDSYATGEVKTRSMSGGLIGTLNGKVYNSYAKGEVDISSNGAGGFCGYLASGYVSAGYSTGQVDSDISPRGGFCGYCYASKGLDSYWDIQTSGQSSSGFAIGRTTTQMKTQSNFAGWDFVDTWAIDTAINDGYPHLQWQNITTCVTDGLCDAYCPPRCNATEDPDCDLAEDCCGNFICGECEDCGLTNNAPECNSDCGECGAVCGDGIIQSPNLFGQYEECDGVDSCSNPWEICSNCYCEEFIYWENLKGNKIGNDFSKQAQVEDTVKMVLINTSLFGLSQGNEVDFEVYLLALKYK